MNYVLRSLKTKITIFPYKIGCDAFIIQLLIMVTKIEKEISKLKNKLFSFCYELLSVCYKQSLNNFHTFTIQGYN